MLAREKYERVDRPSNEEAIRIHVITTAEEQAYFNAVASNARFRSVGDLAKLILLQGCCPEEVLSAKVGDFDPALEELRIRGGKTKAAKRTLYLVGEAVETSAKRKQEALAQRTGSLFPSKRRTGYHMVQLNHT